MKNENVHSDDQFVPVGYNRNYDYSKVEDIAGVDYKKAMILTMVFIGLNLFAKDIITNSFIWILSTTGLSVYIWIYFKKYFDATNDKATAKWLNWLIGGNILFGLVLLFTSQYLDIRLIFENSSLYERNFETAFKLVLIPMVIIFIVGIRIIRVNTKHPFPLKRIAISAMFIIPIYMLISLLEQMPLTNQWIGIWNLIILFFDFAFGVGDDNYLNLFRVGLRGNLFLMIPYFFLLHHFYRAEVDDKTR